MSRRPASSRRLARAMAGAALLATALTGCRLHPGDNVLPGQTAVGSDGYPVTVTFERVENLVPNSAVMRDDVTIGTVADIEVKDWQARVTLRLLKDVDLPANATFAIGQKTLLGAQYVEVVDPAEPRGRLAANTAVPVSQTGAYPATEQVLGAASLLLNNGGLSQLSTITGELNKTLDGRTTDVRSVVRSLDALLATLDRNRIQLISTLDSLDRLSEQLVAGEPRLRRAVDRIGPGLKALNRQRDLLVQAVTRTGAASVQASRLIEVNQQALLGNLADLRPVLSRISTVADEIPEALKLAVSVPFPIMTSGQALRGDYANLFATVDVSNRALLENFVQPSGGTPIRDGGAGDLTQSGLGQLLNPPTPPLLGSVLGGLLGGAVGSGGAGGSGTATPKGGSGSSGGGGAGSTTTSCGLLGSLLGGCR